MRRAVELDPLVPGPLAYLTFALVNAGRTDEAWETLARLRTMDSNPLYEQYYGRLLLQKKRVSEAIPYFPNEEPGSWGFLGLTYGLLGRRAEAEELRKSEQHPNRLALICAGLGDKDCVIEALNRMVGVKDQRIHYYLRYPELSLIRGDPRLVSLKKKIGL